MIHVPVPLVHGGTVTATGGSDNDTANEGSAGIGSGYYGKAGDIILSGGTITATAGGNGNGIGAGHGGSCDNITITKGVTSVTVTGDIGGARVALFSLNRDPHSSLNTSL